MYKALHSDVTIKESSIHGMGVFAICIKVIPKDNLYPKNWPMVKEDEKPSSMAMRTSRDIKGGEELTVFYTLYKID